MSTLRYAKCHTLNICLGIISADEVQIHTIACLFCSHQDIYLGMMRHYCLEAEATVRFYARISSLICDRLSTPRSLFKRPVQLKCYVVGINVFTEVKTLP
jgi:hypothetical protein